MTGWQDYVIADDGERALQALPPGVPPTAALGLFGITGMTAYFGLLEVGKMKEGDVVVVSGAAGATGSTVGQIAKLKGAKKVIGIAGGREKCSWIADELGFDGAIDYKGENVAARLHEEAPDGIDVYFDNVGGDILNTCLAQLAMKGRVVVCGAISAYNDRGAVKGPSNYVNLIRIRGRMEGFLILDYLARMPEGQAEIGRLALGRQDQVGRARRGGPRTRPRGAQPAVHRRQHRQGDREGLTAPAAGDRRRPARGWIVAGALAAGGYSQDRSPVFRPIEQGAEEFAFFAFGFFQLFAGAPTDFVVDLVEAVVDRDHFLDAGGEELHVLGFDFVV